MGLLRGFDEGGDGLAGIWYGDVLLWVALEAGTSEGSLVPTSTRGSPGVDHGGARAILRSSRGRFWDDGSGGRAFPT